MQCVPKQAWERVPMPAWNHCAKLIGYFFDSFGGLAGSVNEVLAG